MSPLLRAVSVLLLVAAGTCPTTASAQSSDTTDVEAHARFEAGRAALASGHNEDALADFRRAYDLSHRTELLYNIGVAADRMRHDEEALAAFEQYLAESDAVTNRPEVEARIATLRATIAAHQTATEEEEAQPTPVPTASGGPSVPGIALAITGGVIVIVGAVLLGVAESDRASVEHAPRDSVWASFADAASRAPTLEAVGIAALSVGVAAAAVGVVLLVVDQPSSASVALVPTGNGVSLVGTF